MNLTDISQHFATENQARELLEAVLWPDGAVCPHCGVVGNAYKLEARKTSKSPVRQGVWKCRECSKQFTVTVGTIFEDSHIPLNKWLMAMHLMNASKKGISAHQIHRMLGIGYRAAWFMCHRIRHAMNDDTPPGKLGGTVEIDETYVGGKLKGQGIKAGKDNKAPVVSLVERRGRVRSFHVDHVTLKNLRPIIKEHLHGWSQVMTDEAAVYPFALNKKVASHDVVCHSKEEYVRHENGRSIHTNSVESFFALIKRGVYGTFHHISKHHLHRYLSEFDFRYNARDVSDGERTERAIQSVRGKRLTYYETGQEGETSPVVS